MSDNIKSFNQLLTRAIGILYNRHPRPTALSTVDLWNPPLKEGDADYDRKREEANGTLLFLHRNNFVDGDLQDFGNGKMWAINNALLTTGALRIANTVDPNENGKTVGQIASQTLTGSSPEMVAACSDLVARRFL
jgi:hypothetical protein